MVECIRPGTTATHTRVALFDFDGTLSLIRSGWIDVMVPMMVEILGETKSGERDEQLTAVVRQFVGDLTGKQTIYQMIELASQVERRGGVSQDPLIYKRRYLDLLWEKIEYRVKALRDGGASPEDYLIPGSRQLLEALKERGYRLYLASGTDEAYMKEEARLLDVTRYFDGGVYGALDDYKSFSKAILIKQVIENAGYRGEEFLGFGDGYVEIENVKQVGGVAIGVASDEPDCLKVDDWKRTRLIGVGADYIVPNYLDQDELFSMLFPA